MRNMAKDMDVGEATIGRRVKETKGEVSGTTGKIFSIILNVPLKLLIDLKNAAPGQVIFFFGEETVAVDPVQNWHNDCYMQFEEDVAIPASTTPP